MATAAIGQKHQPMQGQRCCQAGDDGNNRSCSERKQKKMVTSKERRKTVTSTGCLCEAWLHCCCGTVTDSVGTAVWMMIVGGGGLLLST